MAFLKLPIRNITERQGGPVFQSGGLQLATCKSIASTLPAVYLLFHIHVADCELVLADHYGTYLVMSLYVKVLRLFISPIVFCITVLHFPL